MHTGYDNFWMYQNNRPEPVLSLPKNDNCSNAVLTDRYKQVLNGGGPNRLSSCISQNSVARSHHSDQFRMTSSQYGWPSSVYSLPFRSSYANNFHSQEAYSNHSSSLSYSSQNSEIYQNYDSRYLRNSNLNFPYVNNITNSDNSSNTAKAQNNANVGRIRVKDVFSLNKNALCDNNLLQSNQMEKQECSLNNAAVMSYFTTYQTKTSSKCADYEKNNLHESNNPTSTYECAVAQQSLSRDHHQYLQYSGLLYQQKNRSIPSDALQTNPLTGEFYNQQKIQRRALNNRRNSNEALHDSKRLKIQPRRNSTGPTSVNNSEAGPCVSTEKSNYVFFSGSVNAEEKLMHNASNIIRAACSQSDLHENLARVAEVNSFKNNSLIGKLRKWRKNHQSDVSVASSPSQNQMNGQEKSMIKITYPHSGQSSFLFLEDSDGSGSNSNLSLPSLLESDSQLMNNSLTSQIPIHAEINAQENVVVNLPADQVMQENENRARINAPNITQSNDSHPSALISPPRALKSNSQNLQKKEPVVGNQENSNAFLNSDAPSVETSENFFQEDKKISIKANICNEVNSLIIKQEALGTENQNGECVFEHQIFHQIIKTEENPDDPFLLGDELDCPESENLNPLKEVTRLDFDNTENIDINSGDAAKGLSSSKKIGSKSKTMSSALKNADNRIKEQDDLKNSSEKEKKKCSAKKKKDKGTVARKKVCTPKKNYKSEINRDKLDLLIEFLNKEEDTVDLSRINETNCPLSLKDDDNDKMKKDVESNRNRRKLSKTCIVKNKNNSREMVSLISHKIARVESLKCSPVTPQTVETNKKLDQSEEKKTSSGVLSDKSFEFSDNHSKTDIPFQTVQTQKDRLEYEKDANVSEGKECQDPSEDNSSVKEREIQEEENIINTMRAFQTLKTHFCMSCNLNSGISSFWINVVSGELRCLNCFKKMLKTEDNVLRLKAEGVDCKDDLEGSVTQKDKMNETVENEDKSNTKTRTENDQSSKLHFTESHDGRKNFQDIKENIKQEVTEKIIESAKDRIVDKSNEKQSLITKSSNPTKRSVSIDDNASLGKIAEEQKNLKMMELKNSKLKENTVKGGLGQDIKELQSRLKRESFTKEDKFPDKAFGLEHKAFPVKLKENCSVGEGMLWNSPNPLEGKKGSLGPKFNGLENYKEELLSDGSRRKNTSKEHISVENLKQISGECVNQEIMDKSEKSCKRNTPKQDGTSETLKKLNRNCQDQVRKSRNSKDKFMCQKADSWEERRIKEVKLIESDKSVAKQSAVESCSCRKTICLENSAKKNCRHEPSEKIKVQSPLKETHKSAPASNSMEKYKKIESPEQTRKRKNSEDGFVSYKVRAVEDTSKVEIKPVSHIGRTKATTKECSSCYKNKTSEHKKINLIDVTEKTNSVSKKESKQPRDAVDKWKTKSDHSEHSKHKGNDWSEVSRGKNQKEFLSSAKQHSQNEIKNNAGFEDKLKSCTSKEDLSFPKAHAFKSFSREMQNGNLFPKVKEWEKAEEKERKYFCGKIPKRCFPSTDRNLTPGLRSPLNYKLEEMSHVIAKKDHYNRIRSSNPNRKFTKESFNKGKICRKKQEENSEANNNERAKEGSVKSRKELEGDLNQRKGAKNQANDLNKGKEVNYFGDRKDVAAEKAESASLMAKLIQKTKKLSWSLLKEP